MKLATSFLMIQEDKEKIKEINEYTDYMHYDIMDGIFTENKTIAYDKLLENTKTINKPKDVHLMVSDIKKYVDLYSQINPLYLTFHIEATDNVLETINYIKSKNIKVGLAINPKTALNDLINYLDKIDLVLVMSVKAGAGGQKFIDISVKLSFLTTYRKENNLDYMIEVDGGINPSVIDKVKNADIIVVGSYITNGDIKEQITKIRRCL